MSTKTPEENESDMEAGMTTAERRRRRRRGGGLRVPSDNVPRRISSPTGEDPSVAIAYNGDGPRPALDPVAPEAVTTLIDPPTEQAIEEVSFESKTREMSAVDLEELGLDSERPVESRAASVEIPIYQSTVLVDADVYTEVEQALPPSASGPMSQAPAPVVPQASGTPPPAPPVARPALTPATFASSGGPAAMAPQAPSAFGTSPGHPPPPTQVASPLAGQGGQAGQGSSAGMSFSSLASAGASSAAITPPASSPAIAPLAPASAPSPALGSPIAPQFSVPASSPSIAPSSGVPTPISSGASAPISAPFSVASAVTVPLTAPADLHRDGHSHANGAHHEEPPPPPRAAKGRAQTLALSEDDLEEFLEESRLESRSRSQVAAAARPASTSEEIGDLDVEVEMDSAAVPAPVDETAAVWKSGRVVQDRRSDRAIGGELSSDRPSERSIERSSERSVDRAAEGEVAADGERRERHVTPLGVPVAAGAAPNAEGGRAKPASIPPPTPGAAQLGHGPPPAPAHTAHPPAPPAPVAPHPQAHPIHQAAPVAPPQAAHPPAQPPTPPQQAMHGAHAAHAPAHPPATPPPTPAQPPAHVTPATSSPAIQPPPGAAGSGAPGRATPPPSPTKPPPAPPKKAPDKRAAAVAAASQQEPDKKSRSKQWFSDVFDEDYLRTLPFLTPQATQAEAELVAASLGTSPGAKLLDVGCGYGRHAMELAARGYHVVGLDLSTPLLVRGGEEAHRRGLTINFIRGDMRELDFDGQFDGAYCLFSTFGYFDDETNKKTAGNIARALRPGGKCVFEILNRDYVIADLPTRVWWEGDGCVVLEEVDFNYFTSRICVNRSVVFDDGRQLEQEISIRAYSLHEVGKLMLAAGFRVLEVSGSYQTRGRFFGNQSRHIIVVAERAG